MRCLTRPEPTPSNKDEVHHRQSRPYKFYRRNQYIEESTLTDLVDPQPKRKVHLKGTSIKPKSILYCPSTINLKNVPLTEKG